MGGCCQICSYNRCPEAIDLHHINPSEKEFGFGSITASPKSWENTIVPELRKCIILCSNCHREFHSGFVNLPAFFQSFDETFADLKKKFPETPCEYCGKLKPSPRKFCSNSCSAKNNKQPKFDWSKIDLKTLLEEKKSYVSIAKLVGCSDNAVRKAAKRMGLI